MVPAAFPVGFWTALLVAAACSCGGSDDGSGEGKKDTGLGTVIDASDKKDAGQMDAGPDAGSGPGRLIKCSRTQDKQSLRILVNTLSKADSVTQDAFKKLFEEFNKCYGISYVTDYRDAVDFKQELRNLKLLPSNTSPAKVQRPDLLTWRGEVALTKAIADGTLLAVTDIWNTASPEQGLLMHQSVKNAVTHNGEQYGIPFAFKHWAIYYRSDLVTFAVNETKSGETEPLVAAPRVTWKQFISECERIVTRNKDRGEDEKIAPIAVVLTGDNKESSASATAWFNYLNIRLNGLDFHQQFVRGEIPYNDVDVTRRVDRVMQVWSQLFKKQCFLPVTSFAEAAGALYRGKAAMVLATDTFIGDLDRFVARKPRAQPAPADRQTAWSEKYGVFRFPTDVEGRDESAQKRGGELVPMRTLHILASTANQDSTSNDQESTPGAQKSAARLFMEYFAWKIQPGHAPEKQWSLLPTSSPANTKQSMYFLRASAKILRQAEGVSQHPEQEMDARLYKDLTKFMKTRKAWKSVNKKLEQRRKKLRKQAKNNKP